MTHQEIKTQYKNLHLKYSAEGDQVYQQIRKYGMIRIIVFLVWIIAIYISTSWGWPVVVPIIIIGGIAFGFLVKKHSNLHRRHTRLKHLIKINEDEKNSMEWKFDYMDTGTEYIREDHLFSYDLDLFGKGSLFQYLNRTATTPGKDRLSNLITHIEKSKKEITDRQKAVSELSDMFAWRQDFRAMGLMVEENPEDIKELKDWVNSPFDFKELFFKLIIYIIPLITLAVFVLSLTGMVSYWMFLGYLVIPLMFAGIRHRKVNKKHNMLGKKYPLLNKYSRLFKLIEEKEFSSERMKNLQADMQTGNTVSSKAIHDLARIANAFDTRMNLLAGFLMNVFFLWDIRQSLRLERWQEKYRDHLPGWFTAMAETDAFLSLAGYGYNNPDYAYPEISEAKELKLEGKMLGHPLINQRKRVDNDFTVDGWGSFTILTGANMAGKSTFLRTVGVNMILACSGAPVCAKSFLLTPVELVTSIHTIDSLANNESYFYAELKRLKMIIDMLKEGSEIFIILDEILKGTNSRDKQSGSKALIEQLISLHASGIIATHDLSLGELEKLFPKNVQNRCFEIIIEKDRLDYDYKVKPGIAKNMNATILMQRMGITVE